MARDDVVDFLNQVAQDPSLRSNAQTVYRSEGLDGLVSLASEQGKTITSDELEAVISPAELNPGAQGTSIGWG